MGGCERGSQGAREVARLGTMIDLPAAGAKLLGGSVQRADAIHGGDLSDVFRVTLEDGREVIVKGGRSPAVEAAMLRAIVESGAPAPRVFAADDTALVMEFVDAQGGAAWRSLGSELAKLHAAAGHRFGWPEDYAFGPVAIPNRWSDSWPDFWGEHRLLTHLPHVSADLGKRLVTLSDELGSLLPTRPTASLLHGDLWSGNVMFDGGRLAALIDPACYYGHSEVDFAMLELFGGPSKDFYTAYGPLEAGRADRLPIYQLWPALVHLRLFGAGYRPFVERLLGAVGF